MFSKPSHGIPSVFRWVAMLAGLALLGLLTLLPLSWQDQAILGLMLFGVGVCINRFTNSYTATVLLMIISIFCTVRYAWWRVSETFHHLSVNGWQVDWIDASFVFLLLGAEAYAVMVLLLGYFQTVRPLGRKPLPLPENPDIWPMVDIFIPTYNEPLEVVRPTVLAALGMDYPTDRFAVHILDDGRRPEFEAFATECGSGYITRPDNSHAKAGNINHALGITTGEYVAIFDCDHVATRSFLQMTMGWFLRDSRLGMLQTPHHFYSPDPFERNLGVFRKVPNEGSLFYGVVQDGADLWNAAFFCGSCAVIRRTALQEIGGVAVETVTEDAHTSLRMQRKGWNTAYISIPQAAGLATGSLAAHIGQRIRWARGMVQILRIDNPLFASGLKWHQRLSYFNSVSHYLYAIPRLVFLTAPLFYLILGRSNLYGYIWAILAYAFPHLALASITNSRVQGGFRHSFWNELYETVLAPYILLPTTFALINPRWGKFNVTAKASVVDDAFFDWKIARPYLALIALNLIGIGITIPRLVVDGNPNGVLFINVFWAACNTLMLGGAVAVASEKQQRRSSVRIANSLPVTLTVGNTQVLPAETINVSEGGLAVQLLKPSTIGVGDALVAQFSLLDGDYELPVNVVAKDKLRLRLNFDRLSLDEQSALTKLIYSRADSWISWKDSSERDRILRSLATILGIGLRGLLEIPGHLFPRRNRLAGQPAQQPALPLVVIAVLVLLAFAFRASAAAPTLSSGRTTAQRFADSYDIAALGHRGVLTLRGPEARSSLYFGVPATKIVDKANLRLQFRYTPGLDLAASTLHIVLNGTEAGSLALSAGQQRPDGGFNAEIELPADLLMSDNSLVFHSSLRCQSGCDANDADANVWIRIEVGTAVQVQGTVLPLANDLSLLPAPFFDRSVQRAITIPVFFGDSPDLRTLEAAGVIASWFGVHADHRGTRFPVSIGQIPSGNAIVFARAGSEIATSLQVGNVVNPTVLIRENPVDPASKVLVITGGDTEAILTAARALAAGAVQNPGERAEIADFKLPAVRAAHDAPKWMDATQAVRVAGTASSEQLTVYGGGTANLYFRIAPDLDYRSRSSVPLTIRFKTSGIGNGSTVALHARLNGSLLGSRKVVNEGDTELYEQTLAVPVAALYPSNTLTLEFQTERSTSGSKSQIGKINILRDSGLDLEGATHFVRMPQLELLAHAGFPFTRFADLSRTGVVLPKDPTAEQLELYLTALGFFGAQTGVPGLRVVVSTPEEVDKLAGRDLLVIGSFEDQPLFSRWAEHMNVRVNGQARLNETPDIWTRILDLRWTPIGKERHKLGSLLSGDSPVDGIVQSFQSPLGSNQTVVAISTAGSRNIDAVSSLLNDSTIRSDLKGGVTVLHGGSVQAFRVSAARYYLGDLGWRDGFNHLASEYLWMVPLAVMVCGALVAGAIVRRVEARAKLRLENAG